MVGLSNKMRENIILTVSSVGIWDIVQKQKENLNSVKARGQIRKNEAWEQRV